MKKKSFEECIAYCGLYNLPEELTEFYEVYQGSSQKYLIHRTFLTELCNQYKIPEEKKEYLQNAINGIETNPILFEFTKFLIWDMCNARNRCEKDNYQALTPACLSEYSEAYPLLLLLACVEPSMKLLEERGVPYDYYKNIPYRPMEAQFRKLIEEGEVTVSDFSWDLNFYTCSIYLMDRFLFIPYKFGDNFTMYRNKITNQVIALRGDGDEFRSDGQLNGVNEVFDEKGKFISQWMETEDTVTANPINPMGFVKRDAITLNKGEWEVALKAGDIVLALHVPAGQGYVPDRVRNSMALAMEFYEKYYKEFNLKGFWSESWLYDSRLSLVLEEKKSNIIKVQRQFYLYPVSDGDGMLRHEVFGDWEVDPMTVKPKSSLQKAAKEYMRTGARFNALSMIVLRGEIKNIGNMPYITEEDINKFRNIVDSHLK